MLLCDDLYRLIGWMVSDLVRSRATLEAEIWTLQQQTFCSGLLQRNTPSALSTGWCSLISTCQNRNQCRMRFSVHTGVPTMTAISHFSAVVLALLTAIFLLVTSSDRASDAAVLFSGGVVAWTLGEYIVHRF